LGAAAQRHLIMWVWDWAQFALGIGVGFFGAIALAALYVVFGLIGWMNSGSH
jgi:hypothetical protein